MVSLYATKTKEKCYVVALQQAVHKTAVYLEMHLVWQLCSCKYCTAELRETHATRFWGSHPHIVHRLVCCKRACYWRASRGVLGTRRPVRLKAVFTCKLIKAQGVQDGGCTQQTLRCIQQAQSVYCCAKIVENCDFSPSKVLYPLRKVRGVLTALDAYISACENVSTPRQGFQPLFIEVDKL